MLLHRLLIVISLLALPLASRADIAIHTTRLVHQGSERMVSQRIWNQGDKPSLIQAWIDDGDREQPASARGLPFFATPPLFQLEPGLNRDVSVRLVDARALPTDREALYWLNILDLPASEKAADRLNIAYAVRWRIKLFHRPAGLAGTPAAAPAQLAWRRQEGEEGTRLLARNDSPYHVSLQSMSVDGKDIDLPVDNAVIRPYSEWSLPMAGPLRAGRTPLKMVWLDDTGKAQDLEAQID